MMVMIRLGNKVRFTLLSCIVFLTDQLVKREVRKLPLYKAAFSIEGLIEIVHYKNTGAAFSAFSDHPALIALGSIGLLILLVTLLQDMRMNASARTAVAVLVGGGAGNLFDRIVYGGVTDYIRFLWIPFPVFNFADICITGAVMLLVFFTITGRLDHRPEEEIHG